MYMNKRLEDSRKIGQEHDKGTCKQIYRYVGNDESNLYAVYALKENVEEIEITKQMYFDQTEYEEQDFSNFEI